MYTTAHAYTHLYTRTHFQQDYQTYVSRKALKRQSLIVTLNDQNQQELREIQRQREELLRDYEEKRAGMTLITATVINLY